MVLLSAFLFGFCAWLLAFFL